MILAEGGPSALPLAALAASWSLMVVILAEGGPSALHVRAPYKE